MLRSMLFFCFNSALSCSSSYSTSCSEFFSLFSLALSSVRSVSKRVYSAEAFCVCLLLVLNSLLLCFTRSAADCCSLCAAICCRLASRICSCKLSPCTRPSPPVATPACACSNCRSNCCTRSLVRLRSCSSLFSCSLVSLSSRVLAAMASSSCAVRQYSTHYITQRHLPRAHSLAVPRVDAVPTPSCRADW